MILHFHAADRNPAHIATYNPQAASDGDNSEELLQNPNLVCLNRNQWRSRRVPSSRFLRDHRLIDGSAHAMPQLGQTKILRNLTGRVYAL